MSDRIRRLTGLLMIAAAVLLSVIPLMTAQKNSTQTFRTGVRKQWTLTEIPTERNGDVRVNEAEAEELTQMPGIGETIAALLIAERQKNGSFYYAEDLEEVKGIGPRTLERFRDWIDLTLNEEEN